MKRRKNQHSNLLSVDVGVRACAEEQSVPPVAPDCSKRSTVPDDEPAPPIEEVGAVGALPVCRNAST